MNRRLLLAMAIVPLLTVSKARGDGDELTIRWDLIHIANFSGPVIDPGGHASASAQDNSKITLTGSGTFKLGESDEVTGGGTWQTFNPSGVPTANGIYRVTGFIKFDVAPGSLPPTAVDNIGNAANSHSGLAFLRIRYNDGSRGVLVVSCDLPVGTPASVFEGILASKDFVEYWNHGLAMPGVDGNRTSFHFIKTSED